MRDVQDLIPAEPVEVNPLVVGRDPEAPVCLIHYPGDVVDLLETQKVRHEYTDVLCRAGKNVCELGLHQQPGIPGYFACESGTLPFITNQPLGEIAGPCLALA